MSNAHRFFHVRSIGLEDQTVQFRSSVFTFGRACKEAFAYTPTHQHDPTCVSTWQITGCKLEQGQLEK